MYISSCALVRGHRTASHRVRFDSRVLHARRSAFTFCRKNLPTTQIKRKFGTNQWAYWMLFINRAVRFREPPLGRRYRSSAFDEWRIARITMKSSHQNPSLRWAARPRRRKTPKRERKEKQCEARNGHYHKRSDPRAAPASAERTLRCEMCVDGCASGSCSRPERERRGTMRRGRTINSQDIISK